VQGGREVIFLYLMAGGQDEKIHILLLAPVLLPGCAALPAAGTPTPLFCSHRRDPQPHARPVQYMSASYIPQQPILPGSLGVEVWSFHAPAPGDVDIQFGYFPPNIRHPDDTAEFSISIE
jgi:hypothetical protein